MFRITHYAITARSLLQRRNPVDVHLASISLRPPNFQATNPAERERCSAPPPPPPPPPPPKDSRKIFLGAVTMLFLAGGFAVYAQTKPEVRDWLTLNAPWFDDIIAVAFEENMTYKEFVQQCIDDLQVYIKNSKNDRPKECSTDGKQVSIEYPDEQEEGEESEEDEEEKDMCEKLPPPVLTKDICEVEACLKDLGDTVIHNYMTARDACNYYNKLVEESMAQFTIAGMKECHEAKEERNDLVKESLEKAKVAKAKLDDMIRYLDCGVQAPKEAIQNTKTLLKEYQDKITTVQLEYDWQNDKSSIMDVQLQIVSEAAAKYISETETLFPGLKFDSKKPALQGDVDLFLHHSLRYVEKLKEELMDAVPGLTERINRSVESLPQGEEERKKRNAEIQNLYTKKKAELTKELKKRSEDHKAANDKILKESLKRQLERHEETLQIRLKHSEIETTEKLNKMVSERVAAEKKQFKNQLAEMSMKLKQLEDKLCAKLKAERETRRSQELWTAGAALLAATKKGEPVVCVAKEIKAIEKASGGGDKLVETVLKALPNSVREKGVVPESVLRQKYHVMEATAIKVALVEQEGAPLPVYWLSYLQSVFLFMKISGIPQKEIDNPPKEPFKDLDTFDLLQRSRFWMERGNIAAAVRYVNALEGASRAAAASWHDAARSHLETKQIAEAVIAHATALGLQYI